MWFYESYVRSRHGQCQEYITGHFMYAPSKWETTLYLYRWLSLAGRIQKMISGVWSYCNRQKHQQITPHGSYYFYCLYLPFIYLRHTVYMLVSFKVRYAATVRGGSILMFYYCRHHISCHVFFRDFFKIMKMAVAFCNWASFMYVILFYKIDHNCCPMQHIFIWSDNKWLYSK